MPKFSKNLGYGLIQDCFVASGEQRYDSEYFHGNNKRLALD